MPDELKNIGEEYQRLSKEGFDAAVRSFAEVNKGFQALTAEMTDYSKKSIDDGIRAWEQLLGVKSFERAFEIQSQYAKTAYDNHMAELSKLSEMCVSLARNAYKPADQAVAKKAA
ncbi:MAG TPA: phasin family protein [Methyloceanibacter sp.]|nr:phasin family protein [Methyloceanibacter sp.]